MDVARPRRRFALNTAWALVAITACATILFLVFRSDESASDNAEVGPLFEPAIALPATIIPPAMTEVTGRWGLDAEPSNTDSDIAAAGVALHDLDQDGDLDLVVAYDSVNVHLWHEGRFLPPTTLSAAGAQAGARAINIADIDADGWADLLVARTGDVDTIIWGGTWVTDGGVPASTGLEATGSSAGLLAAELSGDGAIDIVRLSRGDGSSEFDILWTADPDQSRVFTPFALGEDPRLSLAGEIADIDHDGLLDIWVTRDLGWHSGGDSVYSRRGDPTGPWTDIAPELGVALEIDGMGITLADLNDDLELDAYISDLGNNEVLVSDGDGFTSIGSTGAARIRPPGADASVVSSSWATGVTDLNLDGRLDLVIANGGFPEGEMANKIPDTEVAVTDPPALLIGVGAGQFAETWPDVDIPWVSASRGLTIGDIDDDGDDDIIIVAVDGTLTALATDTSGPSITVHPSPGCDSTGAVVTITQPDVSFQAPLIRHTYGGQHAPGLTVGRVGQTAVVEVDWPNGTRFTKTLSGARRATIAVPCPPMD